MNQSARERSEADALAARFVALPLASGAIVRLLGPDPAQAATTVAVLTPFDADMGPLTAYVGALCAADGSPALPLEAWLARDTSGAPGDEIVPADAIISAIRLGRPVAGDRAGQAERLVAAVVGESDATPLFYCRKRHLLFPARAAGTGRVLGALPPPHATDKPPDVPRPMLVWDGPPAGAAAVSIFGPAAGTVAEGPIAPFERLIAEQGRVVARARGEADAALSKELRRTHACSDCGEADRCYPEGPGHAYAADRLVLVHAAAIPLRVEPLGEWSLREAAELLGGRPPREVAAQATDLPQSLIAHRAAQAARMAACGPARLLAGERDGRVLAEVVRLKLALVADALEVLLQGWHATGRPHLGWNEHTLRASWDTAGAAAAWAWGFRGRLRKMGLHPETGERGHDGRPLPFPPVFSSDALLPPDAAEAARNFGQPRPATVFIKRTKAAAGGSEATVLVEGLNIAWPLLCREDVLHVGALEWEATLSPAAARDPADGDGLPFEGVLRGPAAALKAGSEAPGCTVRWLPCFGEAIDLYATGLLLLETLLAHDERPPQRVREIVLDERADLLRACLAVEPAQRDAAALAWAAQRCEADTPSAVWTRRNVLYRREDRNAVRLEGFPPALWQAVVALALRMIAPLPGFGYFASRGARAAQDAAAAHPALAELRGLMALLDDVLFGRKAPAAALRSALEAGSR